MANLEPWLLRRSWDMIVFCAGVLVWLAAWNRWTAHRGRLRTLTFLFEDEPEPAVRTLGLMS